MDEQQLQLQIVLLVQAAMQGDQKANQLIEQIMQAAQSGDQQATQLAQMIQAVAQQLQQQQVQSAKFGAKLNYIKLLRGICPEGYETQYFKQGGQFVKQCVKCKLKMEEGGEAVKNPVDAFKCGRKMKKKEKGGDISKNKKGGELPTAPDAEIRYSGGIQRKIKNINPYLNDSFGYIAIPSLTDYDVVLGNDGNFLYDPSIIGKGYDYFNGDSVAIEVPRHIPWIVRNTADPVYLKQNPSEFNRLSRRVDEAKSVTK